MDRAAAAGHRDADGLLDAFIAQAVADDYADLAPMGPGERRPPSRRVLPTALIAVAVAVLIGLIGAVAILTARGNDDERDRTHAELEQRVAAQTVVVEQRQADVDQATARVDALQQDLLDSAAAEQQADQTERLARQAGMAAVAGPGVVVTIDDAAGAQAGSLNRVLDRDLQLIVNALWKMGAAGIAINGQRLTALTAIRSAGDAILVDYRPLSPPYRIEALGTSSAQPDDSDLTRLLDGLRSSYGLDSSVVAGDVALPAGDLRTPHVALVGAAAGEQDVQEGSTP